MPAYEIQPATIADAPTIAAFNIALAAESEQLHLDPPTVAAGVKAVLCDPSKGRYFVARQTGGSEAGTVIGQIMVTFEWSDWRNGLMWWVQSVYVHREHRRQGIFRALFDHVLDAASNEGVKIVRLYVEKDNRPARGTYASLGLSDTGYLVLERIIENQSRDR